MADAGAASTTTDQKEPVALLKELVAQKTGMEAEILRLREELEQFDRPFELVDAEGFPRADIDHLAVRTIRHRIAELQTDHKELMKRIETLLYQVHATAKQEDAAEAARGAQAAPRQPASLSSGSRASASPAAQASASALASSPSFDSASEQAGSTAAGAPAARPTQAFFLVDNVSPESPAQRCGLRIGDQIVQFGTLTRATQTAEKVRQTVLASVGRTLPITVYRNGEGLVELELAPQRWAGDGLLGCHLSPIK
jgi:26S proteasome non-ATPase regulatory subunit 9